jgi:ATP-binding cassette subfamily B multidrug efflux pump
VPFILYFVKQFRTAFLLRMLIVALAAVVDAMLPIFVGMIVGMLTTTEPGTFFQDNLWLLLGMAGIVMLRPAATIADGLLRNHAIAPNLIDLIRWQSHWHVSRQDWTFFQNISPAASAPR